jgi:hypothetical protein
MTVLVIPAGTTWAWAFPITNPSGGPVDLTGWSARAQVRANKWVRDLPVLHEWTTAGPSPNASLADSQLILIVDGATSSAWTWWAGVYDIELTDDTGRVARLDQDDVLVTPEVTHD